MLYPPYQFAQNFISMSRINLCFHPSAGLSMKLLQKPNDFIAQAQILLRPHRTSCCKIQNLFKVMCLLRDNSFFKFLWRPYGGYSRRCAHVQTIILLNLSGALQGLFEKARAHPNIFLLNPSATLRGLFEDKIMSKHTTKPMSKPLPF